MSRRIAFHTFGCKVNQYETESLRHTLALGGYTVVPIDAAADVYLVNSCTVTVDADRSCRQLIRRLSRRAPEARLIVTGCYAERAPEELSRLSSKVEVFGNRENPEIAEVLGVPTACVEAAAEAQPTILNERHRAYLKIQDGCDAHCTYCIIPSVRPDLVSRPAAELMREASGLIDRGFRELVLTGVRLGRYAAGGWDFTRLVRTLVSLPGNFRIRLSSIEVTELPDEVVELAMSPDSRLCPFFHLPLQSGDEGILKRMGRWYSASDYRARVAAIRRRIPEAAFSADVIAGFPGEGPEAFQNTCRLLIEEGFSRLHAFRYSSRPGTSAERLSNPVEERIKAERVRELTALDRQLRVRYAARFTGRRVRVLVEDDGQGYTAHYVRARAPLGSAAGEFVDFLTARELAEGFLTPHEESLAFAV